MSSMRLLLRTALQLQNAQSRTLIRSGVARTFATRPPTEKKPDSDVSDLIKGTMESMTGEKVPPPEDPSPESRKPVSPTKKKKSKVQSSIDKRRDRMATVAGFASLTILAGFGIYLSRPFDEQEARHFKVEDNDGAWKRLRARTGSMVTFLNEPSNELLPDVRGTVLYRPYTLVLELEGLLIKSTWDRERGWRVAKRPGVDYFLAHLMQMYEIVLFTTQWDSTAQPVIQSLDPAQIIPHKLYRSSIKNENGKLIKDLSKLNRDLNRVIAIEVNPEAVSKQPRNAIVLKPWDGNPNDTELVALIPFLEALVANNTTDVPQVLDSFKGQHIPTEYIKREKALKQKLNERWAAEHKGSSSWSIGRIFGVADPSVGADGVPKLPVEREREFWQANTRQNQAMMKEEEEQQKRQMEEMQKAGYKLTTSDLFRMSVLGEPPPPPPTMPTN